MYLSRLEINPRAWEARRDMGSPYEMHRTLMKAFPEGMGESLGRVMFRIEPQKSSDNPTVIVQSTLKPDWARLPKDYLVVHDSKAVNLNINSGTRLRFRLRANPSKRVSKKGASLDTSKSEGKRVGIITEEEQRKWIIRKGELHGFKLLDVVINQEDTPVKNSQSLLKGVRGNGDKLSLLSVLFDGVIEVNAPDKFNAVVASGIGSGKAFGFGMLSVAPLI